MTMLVKLLPPKLRRQYKALRGRMRDIERSPGFIDLPDDDILVVEWDVRDLYGIASRADSLDIRFACSQRSFL